MFLSRAYVSPGTICQSLGMKVDVIHDCYYEINLYKRHSLSELGEADESLAVYLKTVSLTSELDLDYDNWFNEEKGISIEVSYYMRKYFDIDETMDEHIKLMKRLKLEQIVEYFKTFRPSDMTNMLKQIAI
jgi:hypothetical protein